MRNSILIFLLCISTWVCAQSDSSSIDDILLKLSKLEQLQSENDTINTVKAMTDSTYAQSLATVGTPSATLIPDSGSYIVFDTLEYDLGTITQGDIVKQKFVFHNKGKHGLYVMQIIVDCGCTEPEWTQEKIMPGESGHIIATYDSKDDIGKIQKSLTVVHNSGDGYSYLMLKGYVAPKL